MQGFQREGGLEPVGAGDLPGSGKSDCLCVLGLPRRGRYRRHGPESGSTARGRRCSQHKGNTGPVLRETNTRTTRTKRHYSACLVRLLTWLPTSPICWSNGLTAVTDPAATGRDRPSCKRQASGSNPLTGSRSRITRQPSHLHERRKRGRHHDAGSGAADQDPHKIPTTSPRQPGRPAGRTKPGRPTVLASGTGRAAHTLGGRHTAASRRR